MSNVSPSPAAAMDLSEKLVAQALAHLTAHLTDRTWLGLERTVSGQLDYARWTVPGCNFLVLAEMERIREALKAAGWRTVTVAPRFHDARANWEACLTL